METNSAASTSKIEERVQQYNLKWTNYVSNILQGFAEQLNAELLTDVTFSCEGQFIKAHKLVLSTCSAYFYQLFHIHTDPNPLIIMNGIRLADLKQIIQFMYQGEIKVNENDIDPVLSLAETLQVKGLCNVRTNTVPEERNEDGAKVQNKKRRYSHSSISETVTSEDSILTEGRDTPVPEKSVILPPRVPAVPPTTPLPNSHLEEPINFTNASIHEQLNAFKKLHEKIAALPQNKDALMNIPKPPIETKLDEKSQKQSKVICGIAMKIPRPPNAFMVFANEWRKKIADKYPGENNKEISVRLGNIWKSLPMDSKVLYYSAARQAEQEHKVKYPGYTYSPKEARKRKEVKFGAKKSIEDPYLLKIILPDSKPKEDLTRCIEDDEDEVEFVQNTKQVIKDKVKRFEKKATNSL